MDFRYETRELEGRFTKTSYAFNSLIIERSYTRFIFISFFLLVTVFLILSLWVKEFSILLQIITGIAIGLWGAKSIILPENIPYSFQFVAEQAFINTYILTGIIVVIWLPRRMFGSDWEITGSTHRVEKINRIKRNNLKRRPSSFSLKNRFRLHRGSVQVPKVKQTIEKDKPKKRKGKANN